MLKFPDDTQTSVFGLDEILSELYTQGRTPNDETGAEILTRLEDMHNYIPASENVRREYRYLLLREYRTYIKEQTEKKEK